MRVVPALAPAYRNGVGAHWSESELLPTSRWRSRAQPTHRWRRALRWGRLLWACKDAEGRGGGRRLGEPTPSNPQLVAFGGEAHRCALGVGSYLCGYAGVGIAPVPVKNWLIPGRVWSCIFSFGHFWTKLSGGGGEPNKDPQINTMQKKHTKKKRE